MSKHGLHRRLVAGKVFWARKPLWLRIWPLLALLRQIARDHGMVDVFASLGMLDGPAKETVHFIANLEQRKILMLYPF